MFAALAPALMLMACERTQTPEDAAPPAPVESPSNQPKAGSGEGTLPKAVPGGRSGTDDGSPNLTPPELTPEAERGVEGARNILLSFARAIEQEKYDQAWALLSPADKRKWSSTQFAALFADLGKITVAVPGGTMEGAAGSTYYAAPIAITGNDKEGRPVRIEGQAVLRRVNDVGGATLEQRRWHFEMLTLDWTH